MTTTIEHEHDTRTFTTELIQGQGWLCRCFTTYKGEDSGELHWSNQRFHATEAGAIADLDRRIFELTEMGWEIIQNDQL